MFAAELLMGGNPITGALGGAACCAVAAGTLYAMRRKIPHPSEFWMIGCCCLRGGCHTHEKFNLVVEVNEGANIPKGSPIYIYLECGRFDATSSTIPVDGKTQEASIFERLKIHVRQKDNVLKVVMYRKGTISSTVLGELELDVVDDIIKLDYPQQQWYTLKKEGKSTVKVKLSFHRVNADFKSAQSPLVDYAMLKAARGVSKGDEGYEPPEFDKMDDRQKLRFLSRVLEGPLRVLGVTGWTERYFKVVEKSRDRWQWVCWKDKDAMTQGQRPKLAIPLLAISLVLPDSHNRQQFYVKYYKKSGPADLFLGRVDRDRDLWSDGLYEFLERLRAYLEAHPPKTDIEAFVTGDNQRVATSREKVVLDPKVRTLMAPSRQGAPAKEEPEVPRIHQPTALGAMVEEAMQGYEEDLSETLSSETEDDTHGMDGDRLSTREKIDSQDYDDDETKSFLHREGSTGGPI